MAGYNDLFQQYEKEKKPASRFDTLWESYQAPKERSLAGDVGAFITGLDREETIPTLSDIGIRNLDLDVGAQAKLAGLIATSFDDKRLKQGLTTIIPDVQFEEDKYGNLVAIAPTKRDERGQPLTWERFYPNPKGLADPETAFQVAGAATAAVPISKIIGGTGYTAAALSGGSEAGLYELVSSLLANDKYRIGEPIAGAVGGTLTKGLMDAASKLWRAVRSGGKAPQISGPELQQLKNILRQEGYDPDQIMQDLYNRIAQDTKRGALPGESAAVRTAENLPVPVPLTRGDVTGNKETQLLEDALLSGGYGEAARLKIEAQREAQRAALQQNLPAIQSTLAGEGPLIERQAGGKAAQESLVTQKTEAKQAATAKYEAAQATPTYIDPDAGQRIGENIYNTVARQFSEASSPQAFKILREDLDPVLRLGQSLDDIFAARSKLSNHSAQGGPEGAAAGRMAAELDKQLIEQLDDTLLHGDPDAIAKWLDAVSNYKDFKGTWETEGILKKLTDRTKVRDGERSQLIVAPEEAANAIFGVALNPNKTNLARDLAKLKQFLPTDVWNGVRQEFFFKLQDQIMTPSGDMKGAAFTKAWSKVKQNKTLLNTLFTKEEQATIDGLATTALRISSRAQNFSNSANSLLGAFARFAQVLGKGPTMQGLGQLPGVAGVKAAVGYGAAARPPLRNIPPYNIPAAAAGGTTAGGESAAGLFELLFGEDEKQ